MQKVSVLSDIHGRRCDNLLADRVDRRICHLGKLLFEIVRQLVVRLGQHRDRRVDPHRADALPAVPRHRQDTGLELIVSIAKRLLHALPLLVGECRHPHIRYL